MIFALYYNPVSVRSAPLVAVGISAGKPKLRSFGSRSFPFLDLQDFFSYSGKFRPEMYLSDRVRRGISTFAALADPEEMAEGCRRLEEDIASGEIVEVQRRYVNSGGDYIFLRAAKPG
jgi:hypothetical protein